MPVIGPTLPPHLSNKRKAKDDEDASPPSRKRPRSFSPNTSPPTKRRPIGPAPPPADLSTEPSTEPDGDENEDDTSDDDDFGPSLPPLPGSASHDLETKRLQNLADSEAAAATKSAKPQREEWMLLPPSADGLNSTRMDPTKLKNRKFQSGKGAKAPTSKPGGGGGIGETWTETPEQKRQRLEDEVLGKKKPAQLQDSGDDANGVKRKMREEEDREAERRIREYNERHRGKALMDEGSWTGVGGKRQGREEEDDPSKRGFDREKDMKVGGTVGYAQKREMLNSARNMGDRFARGSYL